MSQLWPVLALITLCLVLVERLRHDVRSLAERRRALRLAPYRLARGSLLGLLKLGRGLTGDLLELCTLPVDISRLWRMRRERCAETRALWRLAGRIAGELALVAALLACTLTHIIHLD